MSKKKIGYFLWGFLSSFYRLFPLNKRKIVLFMIHNDYKCGNLRYMYEALLKENPENYYIFISKAELFKSKISGYFYFYFILNYHLMTAKEIYLNDNFLPLAFMPLRKNVKLIQLWHGIGAFKRFGLSSENDDEVRKLVQKGNKKVTHLFVSGKSVVSYYKEAFQVDKERIYPVGLPVLDYYFDEERKKKARERFYSYFSELKNKKLLLYTPTFRKTLEENHALLKKISFSHLKELLGDEWAILIRLHPTMITRGIIEKLPKGVYDMSTYQDIKDLYEVSDVLVNDYSSTVVEYSLLKKPVIFFAPDLEEYDRGFYRDFKETVPGNIVMDLESLVREIKEEKTDNDKLNYFLSLHYDYFDSNNSNRILEIIRNG